MLKNKMLNLTNKELKRREKISNTLKRLFKEGKKVIWNKGMIGFRTSGSFKKGHKIRVGMKHTEETKKKISNNRKGKLTRRDNPMKKIENRMKVSRSMIGKISNKKGKNYEEIYGKS